LCTILWRIEKIVKLFFVFCGSDEKPQWRKAAYTQLIPGARAWREVGIYESLARGDG